MPPAYNGIVAEGKHVRIFAPVGERNHIDYFVKSADHDLEWYAHNLHTQLPDQRFDVYLYDTAKDFEKVNVEINHIHTNTGLCRRGVSYIQVQSGPGGAPVQDVFVTEAVLAHELCHAVHQQLFPSYAYAPNWLQEGVADAWSEEAMNDDGPPQAERSNWYSADFENVENAIHRRQLLSFHKMMMDHFVGHNPYYCSQLYGEAYTLIRMLDDGSPSNAKRRARFRQFLQEVNAASASKNTWERTNSRFLELFSGDSGKTLNSEYKSYVARTRIFSWFARNGNVQILKNGDLRSESFANQATIAFNKRAICSPNFKIFTDIDLSPKGSRRVDIVLSNATRDYYYLIDFNKNCIAIMSYDGAYHIAVVYRGAVEIFQYPRHHLEVSVRNHDIIVRLDGKQTLNCHVKDPRFPKQCWGVGGNDSAVTFSNLHLEPLSGASSSPS